MPLFLYKNTLKNLKFNTKKMLTKAQKTEKVDLLKPDSFFDINQASTKEFAFHQAKTYAKSALVVEVYLKNKDLNPSPIRKIRGNF